MMAQLQTLTASASVEDKVLGVGTSAVIPSQPDQACQHCLYSAALGYEPLGHADRL